MNARTTTILGWLTLIAVLLAIWLLFGESERQEATSTDAGEKLYPALSQKINAASAIEIKGYGSAVHLRREGADWRLAEKDGYPADVEKVRRLLKGLVRTEILARKTDKPKYYERLELDPKHEKRLIVRATPDNGQGGDTLVDLHVGKRNFVPRQRRFETFVRREGEARVLLVTGLPEVKAEAGTWLPDSILDLDFSRVRSLVIHHPDGETLTIRRDAPGGDFMLVEKKEGEVYKGYRPTDHVVNALAYVALKDVRPAAGFKPSTPPAVLEVATFDGLRLKLTLFPSADESGDHWMLLGAGVDRKVAELAKADADKGATRREGDGTEEKSDAADADAKAGEAARATVAEAERLAHLARGWAILIPASTAEQLLVHRDDLVRPGEPKGDAKSKAGTAKKTAGSAS